MKNYKELEGTSQETVVPVGFHEQQRSSDPIRPNSSPHCIHRCGIGTGPMQPVENTGGCKVLQRVAEIISLDSFPIRDRVAMVQSPKGSC